MRQGKPIKPLHTVKETAGILRRCEYTIHRLRWRGELGFYRIGNKIGISDEHIEAYLRRVEHKPVGPVGPIGPTSNDLEAA